MLRSIFQFRFKEAKRLAPWIPERIWPRKVEEAKKITYFHVLTLSSISLYWTNIFFIYLNNDNNFNFLYLDVTIMGGVDLFGHPSSPTNHCCPMSRQMNGVSGKHDYQRLNGAEAPTDGNVTLAGIGKIILSVI
jgi:hypothetical protein